MLLTILKKLFPHTCERIQQQEADKIFAMMAHEGYLSAAIGKDLVVCGLVRVIPISELRKDEREKYGFTE